MCVALPAMAGATGAAAAQATTISSSSQAAHKLVQLQWQRDLYLACNIAKSHTVRVQVTNKRYYVLDVERRQNRREVHLANSNIRFRSH